jgi:predicted TIM-barrel fold metal-dependent hydrolase
MSGQKLIHQMDQYGIDYTIVSSAFAVRYDMKEGNAQLYQELKRFPRIKGYVTVNLNYPKESIEELHTYFGKQREENLFVGVKIHPMMTHHRFDTPEGLKIAEVIASYDVPILIHTYGSEIESPLQVVKVLERYQNLKIILAHSGGFDWNLATSIASVSNTLFAEICSSCTSSDKLKDLIEAFGPNRVIFGTDTTLFHPSYSLGMVEDAQLETEVYRQVMGENARRLCNIPTGVKQ